MNTAYGKVCEECKRYEWNHEHECPKHSNNIAVVDDGGRELVAKQTEALTVLAKATNEIANFITSGGLSSLLSGYARTQAVKDILGGLAAHDGRNSLDARVLGQNALEITEAVEAVFQKYADRMADKEQRDPEIHAAVEEYQPLKERE